MVSIAGIHYPLSLDPWNEFIRKFKTERPEELLLLLGQLRKNTQRYRIFDAGEHMIRPEQMNRCLAAQTRFMLFKEPGFFIFLSAYM
jgi:hypothetical protein